MTMKKWMIFVLLLGLVFGMSGCASTAAGDLAAGRDAYPDDSIFHFLYVSDRAAGIYDVKTGMSIEKVLDVLGIPEDQVQIIEPYEDAETGVKISTTSVYADLDRTFAEFPDFSLTIIFIFDDNGYQKAQIGLRYYDMDVDKVNDIVDSTVELMNGKFKKAKMFTSGDYQEHAMMDDLDSRCLIQWMVDDKSPLAASFSIQVMTESEAVAADNVFGISFQVTA